MAISAHEIIYAAVGFFLAVIITPIGMTYIVATNSTFGGNSTQVPGGAATYSAVYSIFTILVPVLYMIGLGLHFIPKLRK